jgi:hypothetical protein
MYTAQWDYHARLLAQQVGDIDKNARPALRIAESHKAPEEPELKSAIQDLEQRYNAALASLGSGVPLPTKIEDTFGKKGSAPFTLVELNQIVGDVKGMESAAKGYLEIQKGWQSYVAALKAYNAMLAAVQNSLTTLVARSNDPLAPGGGTEQLIQNATAIRDQAQQIDHLIGSS